MNGNTIEVTLSHNGASAPVTIPANSDVGHIRTLEDQLENLGAPSNYTFGVNGMGCDDTRRLMGGETITFRPVQGDKGHEQEGEEGTQAAA